MYFYLLFLGIITLHASTIDEINTSNSNNVISMYSIKPKSDQAQVSNNGGGLYYNSQNIKFKVEKSADFVKTGAIIKVNPLQDSLYVKLGVNYLNQNLDNYSVIKRSVSQYSGALGVGYMLYHDFDLELGSSVTELIGDKSNTEDEIASQTIKDTYCQIVKRADTRIGTIDVTVKGSRLYNKLASNEENYGSSLNYYPDKNVKLDYFYTNMQNNVSSRYALNYGYFTTEYANNISQNTYTMTVGFKAKFIDITDFSSYIVPMIIKSNLTRSHKFDDMVLYDNMNIRI